MGSAQADPRKEFSRIVAIADLSRDRPATWRLTASAEERVLLAERLELQRLDRLEGELRVAAGPQRGQWLVTGRLVADIVQTCVVSLTPAPGRIEEEFSTLYAESGAEPSETEDDSPVWEPTDEAAIDLGEEIAQQLALALDPYPRASGVEVDERWSTPEDEFTHRENPFKVLADWRSKGS